MAIVHIELKDYTSAYLSDVDSTVAKSVKELGKDLQATARAAAPEKTGYLVDHIQLAYSKSAGAYQSDVESTAYDSGQDHEYANWMHSGKPGYRLGNTSRAKGTASSPLGHIRKRVGPGYLQGTGTSAKKGYQSYLINQVDLINRRYGK